MLFHVNPASTLGLAEQVAGCVRGALAAGDLGPGDRLPPAREVAAGLDVNVHTVLRGYAILRDEGLIDLRRRRGAQVRGDLDRDAWQFRQRIREAAREAARLGWSVDEVVAAVRAEMSAGGSAVRSEDGAPGAPGDGSGNEPGNGPGDRKGYR